jgi:myo-inositol 2-dehydrogenase / D-chiro-inositol 1-dehydrogenase
VPKHVEQDRGVWIGGLRPVRGASRAKQEHPQAEVDGDAMRLVERHDIDIVDVVVPNQLHFEIARAALRAGKHVLLEKPMALRGEHCDELVELAKAQRRILAVGHELRLSSLWGHVKQLIDEGRIGQVQHVLIELSRFPYRQGSAGWRYDQQRVGNWILEEPIHFFDLARWYMSSLGDPISVYARANGRHVDRPELNDNFSAIVNFPRQGYAVISQTLAAFGHHQTAKIAGTDGTIWAEWGAADARSPTATFGLRYGLGDDVTEVAIEQGAGELIELSAEIAAVTRSVRDGTPPPCTAEDGRWSTRLCLAAQRSVETGELCSIPTAG